MAAALQRQTPGSPPSSSQETQAEPRPEHSGEERATETGGDTEAVTDVTLHTEGADLSLIEDVDALCHQHTANDVEATTPPPEQSRSPRGTFRGVTV